MPASLRFPGLRTVLWTLSLAVLGGLLGLGLNQVSPTGINMKIALAPEDPAPAADPSPAPTPAKEPAASPRSHAAGVKP